MRTKLDRIKAVLLVGLAGLLTFSCVKYRHDPVPDNSGAEWFPENARIMTVEEMKGRFPGNFDSVGQFMEVVSVTDSLTGLARMDTVYKDIYLHVVVIGNDISGNLYKSMYVRDVSQPGMDDVTSSNVGHALNIAVDKTGLYNFYPVGQELYIKCSGLYFGRYENLPQLGYRYADDNGIVDLGRIPDVVFTQHVTKTGLPPVDSADLPQPIEITDAAQLDDPSLYNQLVVLRGVQFAGDEVGEEFAPAPPVGTNPTSTNRYFTFADESAATELVLRTSSACRFFREPVPAGTGDMTCIFAIYDDTKQFYLRSYTDLDTAKFHATSEKDYPIFYASFANGISKFRIVNVLGDATWTHGSYGGGCAMIQGSQNYRPNEDWLISDAIEVPADRFDIVTLAFNQALSYKFDSPYDYYTVRVSENYDPSLHSNPNEAEWTTLTIPNPHPGDNFTFESSGNIDMRAYKGKTIRIAFVYKSDDSAMATWEINRIRLLGNN